LCLVVAHLEWPLMCGPSRSGRTARAPVRHPSSRGGTTWPATSPGERRRSYRRRPVLDPASTSTAVADVLDPGRPDEDRVDGPPRPGESTSPSKESTCRPKALRRTVMSMPPRVSWSGGRPATGRRAGSCPAHEPYAGSPPRAGRSGSRSRRPRQLVHRGRLAAGQDDAVRPSSSAARRTGRRGATARSRRPGAPDVALQAARRSSGAVTTHSLGVRPDPCRTTSTPRRVSRTNRGRGWAQHDGSGAPSQQVTVSACSPGTASGWPSGRTRAAVQALDAGGPRDRVRTGAGGRRSRS
jgi:hypothetical protein